MVARIFLIFIFKFRKHLPFQNIVIVLVYLYSVVCRILLDVAHHVQT